MLQTAQTKISEAWPVGVAKSAFPHSDRAAHINTLFSASVLLSTSQTHFCKCIHCSLLFVDLLCEGHLAWREDLGTFCFVCQREGAEFYSEPGWDTLSSVPPWHEPVPLLGRIEPWGIPELGLSPSCPGAGRARLEKILDCVSIILASDSFLIEAFSPSLVILPWYFGNFLNAAFKISGQEMPRIYPLTERKTIMCKKKIITFPLNRNVLPESCGTFTALGVSGQTPSYGWSLCPKEHLDPTSGSREGCAQPHTPQSLSPSERWQ